MWSDAQILLLILAALYLGECLVWTPARAVLVRIVGGRWVAERKNGAIGNRKGSFRPISFLPSAHRALIWEVPGLSLGPDHIVAFTPDQPGILPRPNQSGLIVPWAKAGEILRKDRSLLFDGTVLATARSAESAERWLKDIRSCAEAKIRPEREKILRAALAAELREEPARDRLSQVEAVSALPSWAGVVLFAGCFAVAPAITTHFGVNRALLWVFVAALALHLPTVLIFFRAHRRLLPDRRADRWVELFKILVSPPMAMRAADTLWLHGLDGLHPLALLAVQSNEAGLKDLSRHLLLDLRHPIAPAECPEAGRADELWFRQERIAAIEVFLKAKNIEPATLLAPTAGGQEGIQSYCPRCQQGFTVASGECSSCGGMALVALAKKESENEPARK
jgi:hypothetical protein